uniref:Uncharacterized protein n=1 Tax=Capitella teleta TaxID=283909 RepID=X2A7S0_CAPTE
MIKLLQKRGTAIPTFVSDSGNLSAMPPVTFDSMNVVSLLRRIQSTQEEVSTMKALMASQSETMGCVTKLTQDLSGRVGNIEAIYVRSEDSPMQDNATEVMQSNEELKTAVSCRRCNSMKRVALDPLPATYTQVLKRRPRKKKVVPALVDDGQQVAPAQKQRHAKKSVVGTAACELRTVKTKLIRVFVTGMVHETKPAEMEKMLKEKMNNNTVKCELIKKGERSSSFCVSAECLSADGIYDPTLWPEGSYVRRYYSDRKTSQANSRS